MININPDQIKRLADLRAKDASATETLNDDERAELKSLGDTEASLETRGIDATEPAPIAPVPSVDGRDVASAQAQEQVKVDATEAAEKKAAG